MMASKYPKLYLIREGERKKLSLPEKEATSTPVGEACPSCGEPEYKVSGGNRRISSDDRAYESDAYCCKCNTFVGTLRLEVDTLFGLREDNAVLNGRCRVY